MKRKFFCYAILMLLMASFAFGERYFVLDVNYISGSLTFNSISLKEVDRIMKHTENRGFLVKVKSFSGSDLQAVYYDMTENKNYAIYLPYSREAAKIEVYNPSDSKVMDIETSSFADTCGNDACEGHESYESCTKDCVSGSRDDFCDGISDGVCDPDCIPKNDADCAEEQHAAPALNPPPSSPVKKETNDAIPKKAPRSINYFLWGSIIIAGAIPVLIFTFVRKRKEQTIINTLKQYITENIRRGFTLQQIRSTLYQQGYNDKEINKAVRTI